MKHLSLTENHLFGKAYSNGKRYCGKYACVFVLRDKAAFRIMKANPEKQYLNRVGLTVSKKIGGAVERNRAKRIIRAAYDGVKPRLARGYLIVISAREAIDGRSSGDILQELNRGFEKLGLLRSGNITKEQ